MTEKKGSDGGRQTFALFGSIIQRKACLGLRVTVTRRIFKVKPNFRAKSCLGKLESCQKTREDSKPLYKQALRDTGCCSIKLSVWSQQLGT